MIKSWIHSVDSFSGFIHLLFNQAVKKVATAESYYKINTIQSNEL